MSLRVKLDKSSVMSTCVPTLPVLSRNWVLSKTQPYPFPKARTPAPSLLSLGCPWNSPVTQKHPTAAERTRQTQTDRQLTGPRARGYGQLSSHSVPGAPVAGRHSRSLHEAIQTRAKTEHFISVLLCEGLCS